MSRIQTTYRLAKLLMQAKGLTAHDALEEAKRKVGRHPTAEQIRAARELRERIKNGFIER